MSGAESLEAIVGNLSGRRCVDVIHSVGSIISLVLEGEVSLLVFCAWRAEHGLIALATSEDSAELIDGLRSALVGKQITSAVTGNTFGDLLVEFEEETCFRVFCDRVAGQDNYSITLEMHEYGWARETGLTVE